MQHQNWKQNITGENIDKENESKLEDLSFNYTIFSEINIYIQFLYIYMLIAHNGHSCKIENLIKYKFSLSERKISYKLVKVQFLFIYH